MHRPRLLTDVHDSGTSQAGATGGLRGQGAAAQSVRARRLHVMLELGGCMHREVGQKAASNCVACWHAWRARAAAGTCCAWASGAQQLPPVPPTASCLLPQCILAQLA